MIVMKSWLSLVVLPRLSLASGSHASKAAHVRSLEISDRVNDLLSRMTFLEQLAQTRNIGGILDASGQYNQTFVETFNDGYGGGSISFGSYFDPAYTASTAMSSIISSELRKNSLGIPLINVADSVNGVTLLNTTLFPASLSMSASWNIPLFEDVINAISIENRAVGVHWVFSPELDLAREPRYGRVGEMYGEDPYLVSRFGVAYVQSMQAPDANGTLRVAATVKHFVYGSSQGGINIAPIDGGVNDFYNIYSLPYRAVIAEANPASLMASYASYDGVPMTSNMQYTHDFLRDELRFAGVVTSDYAAISDLWQSHKTARNITVAGLGALKAGVDHEIGLPEMSGMGAMAALEYDDHVRALVRDAAGRMLNLKFLTGTFENPTPDLTKINETLRSAEHMQLNLQMSKESMVLLKNDGILPLDSDSMQSTSIAVIGDLATYINAGSYAADDYVTGSTILRGIRSMASDGTYSRGCFLNNDTNADEMIAEAVTAAKAADLVVMVLGSSSSNIANNTGADRTDGEGYDHAHLGFPGPQPHLLQAVVETGVPVILVVSGGQTFEMEYAAANVSTIIHTFLQGDLAGGALASILIGETNPSGKLTVSTPRYSGAIPIYYNYMPTERKNGPFTADDWQWPVLNRTARYPFGYGLSYTKFSFSDVYVSNYTSVDGHILANVTVTNEGAREGQEVVQVYFGQDYPQIERPVKNLIRFSKISLAPGASQVVSFVIPISELGYYVNGVKQVDEDDYTIWVGSSSDDVDLTQKTSGKA